MPLLKAIDKPDPLLSIREIKGLILWFIEQRSVLCPQNCVRLEISVFLLTLRPQNSDHTSNDNPYSESQFKTMKYRPEFPARFGSIEDARSFCQDFFRWYNKEHRHSGIGLFTPEDVHYGRTKEIHQQRQEALLKAYRLHPERFVKKIPEPPELPKAVWINKPKEEMSEEALH